MMTKPGRNTIILSILFFGPLLFYLFLLTGTNNFAKLPVLTTKVDDVIGLRDESGADSISLDGQISRAATDIQHPITGRQVHHPNRKPLPEMMNAKAQKGIHKIIVFGY